MKIGWLNGLQKKGEQISLCQSPTAKDITRAESNNKLSEIDRFLIKKHFNMSLSSLIL